MPNSSRTSWNGIYSYVVETHCYVYCNIEIDYLASRSINDIKFLYSTNRIITNS